MTQSNLTTTLAVIGGGPGGYAAAFLAADLGVAVTLVDTEPNPGGVCLFRGCIPSKSLLHAASVIREAREAAAWGVSFDPPKIDVAALRAWKNEVVESLTGGLGQLTRQRKIRFVRGRARLTGLRSMEIAKTDGAREHLEFEQAIVATGSRPSGVPGISIDSPRVMDSTGALDLADIPRTLLVVGGGYIGLEIGTVYASLGSRVTVAEMMPNLLPGVDADLVTVLRKKVDGLFASVRLETTVSAMREVKAGVEATLKDKNGAENTLTFDKVLVAVGRKPNTEGLGLDDLGVEITERGFVKIDHACRTNVPSLFAIGDVAGEPMLAHKASHEGRVAAETAAGKRAAFEPLAVPAVVFTDPEIAWCGITEREARGANRKITVARFPWAASGRAKTLARGEGVTKLLVDPESERVLGVGIAGPGAGELIAEGALAVEMGATARDLALTIHPHPTLSETLMEAAEVFYGQSTHLYRPRRS
jgi:dihydrolipoamide dehydrogenase